MLFEFSTHRRSRPSLPGFGRRRQRRFGLDRHREQSVPQPSDAQRLARRASCRMRTPTTRRAPAARWADFNPNGVKGNVLVIAASVSDTTPNDQFKISKLDVCAEAIKFYVVDPNVDKTYEYGTTGQSLANYKAQLGQHQFARRGLDGQRRQGVGHRRQQERLRLRRRRQVARLWTPKDQWRLTRRRTSPTNGTDIWIVDDGTNKVFKYTGAASTSVGQPERRVELRAQLAATPTPRASSPTARICGSSTTPPAAPTRCSSTTRRARCSARGRSMPTTASPTGITIDPTNVNHIWIVDSGNASVYRYNSAAGRTSGSQSATSVFQLASSNTNAQGIADPPPVFAGEAACFANRSGSREGSRLRRLVVARGVIVAICSCHAASDVGRQDVAVQRWGVTQRAKQPVANILFDVPDHGDTSSDDDAFAELREFPTIRRSTTNRRRTSARGISGEGVITRSNCWHQQRCTASTQLAATGHHRVVAGWAPETGRSRILKSSSCAHAATPHRPNYGGIELVGTFRKSSTRIPRPTRLRGRPSRHGRLGPRPSASAARCTPRLTDVVRARSSQPGGDGRILPSRAAGNRAVCGRPRGRHSSEHRFAGRVHLRQPGDGHECDSRRVRGRLRSDSCILGSTCIYPRDAPQPMPESALLTGPLEPTNEGYALAKIAGLKLCQ